VNERELGSVGSASSSSEKACVRLTPEIEKAKSWASLGRASLMTTTLPRLVWRNVQVTVSPAPTATALTGLPSEQLAPVKSQSAGMAPCVIANVPGLTKPLSCGALESVSVNAWEIAPGPPVRVNENACGSPDGVVTSSTRIRPRFR
jgi:hypothetical protein